MRHARLVYSTEHKEAEKHGRAARRSRAILVRLERRASGRVVTLVSGLPAEDLPERARRLKSACATGGTLKADVLELQGDHRESVFEILAREGLKAKKA